MLGTRHGILITNGPEGTKEEDAPCCAHCSRIMTVKPFCDPAAWPNGRCKICNGLICDKPECHERCDPIEKKLDRMEAYGRLQEAKINSEEAVRKGERFRARIC